MKSEESTCPVPDGMQLYYQCWQPDAASRAVLVIVHGVNEHSGRFMNLVTPLTAGGYAVYGYDHRGHGRSPGQRVHINAWAEYREDLKAFLETVGEREPGKPVFLYGHSMGALVVLDYIMHTSEGLHGAVISGAPIEPAGVATPALVALARTLTRVWPRFSVKLGVDAGALSRDPEVVRAYQADPLVTRVSTVRWGTEALDTVAWVKAHAAQVRIPVLIIHGEADRINLASGVSKFYEAIPYADKTLRIYPGGYHEPHNDLDYTQVAADIEAWLDQHLD